MEKSHAWTTFGREVFGITDFTPLLSCNLFCNNQCSVTSVVGTILRSSRKLRGVIRSFDANDVPLNNRDLAAVTHMASGLRYCKICVMRDEQNVVFLQYSPCT